MRERLLLKGFWGGSAVERDGQFQGREEVGGQGKGQEEKRGEGDRGEDKKRGEERGDRGEDKDYMISLIHQK